MKIGKWLHIGQSSIQWLVILCMNSILFIFLAWVAYPEQFSSLVIMMLTITGATLLLGIVLAKEMQQKRKKVLDQFLKEPSTEKEAQLLQLLGVVHKEELHALANTLHRLHDESLEAKRQSLQYKQFIESWVHEIKTPLSLLHFVLQNRKDEMSTIVYQRLDRASVTIHDYVERILFFAKLQAVHVDYHLKPLSVIECVEDVLLELESITEEQQIKICTNIQSIPIICDERALRFIFMQLLMNAIQYRNTNKESIIQIETGIEPTRGSYYIKIEDNGVGVLQSDVPFLFDKGFTGSKQKQSTGMGLFLVKELCDALHVEIEVESNYEQDFTIKLLFPAV